MLATLGLLIGSASWSQAERFDEPLSEHSALKYRDHVQDSERILADTPRDHEYLVLHFNENLPSPSELMSAGVTSLNYLNKTSIYAEVPIATDLSTLANFTWAMELMPRDKTQSSLAQHFERFDEVPVLVYLPENFTPAEIATFKSNMNLTALTSTALPNHVVMVRLTAAKMLEIAADNRVSWIRFAPPLLQSGDHFHFCLGAGTPYGHQAEFAAPAKFVLQGSDWDGPGLGCADLTYHFENGTPDISGNDEWQVVRDAFAEWVNYAGLTFTETGTAGLANSIDILWAAGDHGDGNPFDGPSGTLAHAYFPEFGGDMHFDEAENWTTTGGGIDLFAVAVHEIGHALGLRHSENDAAVMAPFYAGAISGLHPDDIAGVRAMYSATPRGGGAGYCAASGENSSFEWIEQTVINGSTKTSGNNGGYGNFTGDTPIDLTPGSTVPVSLTPAFSGTVYDEFWRIWIDYNKDNTFSASELVYNGSGDAAISGSFTVPTDLTGTTRMRVSMKWNAYADPCETFGYGEVEDYTVSFSAPALTYCESEGTNSTYEWISAVSLGGAVHNSGDDGGYGDFTGLTYSFTAGTFAVSLTPGFSGSTYMEYWKIWLDLNQNGVFDASEELYAGNGTGIVTGNMTIPAGYEGVTTRMRISMKYNGVPTECETFSFGEVQDYTVTINPAAITAGLSDEAFNFEIYPNPAVDILNIKNASANLRYQLMDATGRIIYNGLVLNQKVNVSALAKGHYFIRLTDGTNQKTYPFIRQ